MKIDSIRVKKVHFMPKEFQPGVLYVSKEFGIAGHLCACGCGNKVMTPLGKFEWNIKDSKKGVSVWPSIGSGQLDCKSHYIIKNGRILWCEPMTDESTTIRFEQADKTRNDYYKSKFNFRKWLFKIFGIR